MNKSLVLLLLPTLSFGILTGCGNNPEPKNPDMKYVKNYKLDDERTYTGWLHDGLPEKEGTLTWVLTNCVYTGEFHEGKYQGQGTFEWKNEGNKLVGTFVDNAPTYGTFTYGNTMHYVGQFNDRWEFHGQGTFDWNTYKQDGTIKSYGWLYEGEFRNGSPVGCVGKVTFTCARDGSNIDGIYWFIGEMSGFPAIKANQKGTGCIHYGDKSVYTGDIFYTGSNWLRKGKGEMYFFPCKIGVTGAFGAAQGEYLWKYVGEFDADVTGWIYGNGIMYYANSITEAPTRWAKGFFNACHILKDYEYEEVELEEGYTISMESPYLRFREDYDKYMQRTGSWEVKHHKFLFIGDSYMEFMNSQSDTPFSKYFGKYDAIDVGCGGSTSADWINYFNDLILPYTPEYLVMHIGGNDSNAGCTPEMVINNIRKIFTMMEDKLPSTKIIMVSQWTNPDYKTNWTPREKINTAFKNLADEEEKFLYLDVVDILYDEKTGKTIDNIESYFRSDRTHMNDAGYLLWSARINEYLDTL